MFEKMLNEQVKMVSMCHTSIIDGYTIPAKEIIELSHEYGALVLLDAALSVPHQQVDVQKLNVDFLVFSLSNMCGPNGLGVLYGKEELLADLTSFLGGGGANTNIDYGHSQYQGPPAKYEAGSQNCASIIGAGAAVDYLKVLGLENIREHEIRLNELLTEKLDEISGVTIVGPWEPKDRGGMVNFNIEGLNPHDIAISIEEMGNILVRSGNLCAHSYINEHMKGGAVSVLFYIYNTLDEVGYLVKTIKELIEGFC
jgi:cysteine desulfurase/selenocysteine lyase